jgi:hypothetical protein
LLCDKYKNGEFFFCGKMVREEKKELARIMMYKTLKRKDKTELHAS